MTSLQTIFPFLQQGVLMAKIDLWDAYFHISIHPSHHKFLRFVIGDHHFQYIALPFGLSVSPRVFSKCVVVIAAHLRLRGIRIFQYLVNWLLIAPSEFSPNSHLQQTLHLLSALGLVVNVEKSCLTPVRRLLYIGAILDSQVLMAFLPLDRAQTLWSLAEKVCSSPLSSALKVQSLLGHMAAAIIVVPFARRYMRPLQLWFLRSFKLGFNSQSKLLLPPTPVHESLGWWTCLHNLQVGVPFRLPPPWLTLTTDTSLWGWGAHLGTSCVGSP